MSKKINEDVKIDKWEVYSKIDVRRNYILILTKKFLYNIFLCGLNRYLISSKIINFISLYYII